MVPQSNESGDNVSSLSDWQEHTLSFLPVLPALASVVWQEHTLSFLPVLPALASVVASSTILYLVIRSGFTSSYKRILFGLSVSDIITFMTVASQPFLLPAATSTRLWALGNDASCTTLGFFTQLCVSTIIYNGILLYYYLFTIRFGVREAIFARRYEPWMHAVAIAFPLFTASAGVGMNAYHEMDIGYSCWITDYPEGCSEDERDCRGVLLGWLFMGFWCMFILVSILVINVVIYGHVRRLMLRGRRNSLNVDRQTRRTNEVAVQCFLYVAAYICTYIWVIILKILDSRNHDAHHEAQVFPLRVLNGLLLPSTGFFNLCIYLRPRYIKTRSEFPTESRLWAVQRALYGESVPPTVSPSSLSSPQPSNGSSKSSSSDPSLVYCPDSSMTFAMACDVHVPEVPLPDSAPPEAALASSSITCRTAPDLESP